MVDKITKFSNQVFYIAILAILLMIMPVAQSQNISSWPTSTLGPLQANNYLNYFLSQVPEKGANAPALKSVNIYAVGSANCKWEYIPPNANSTKCDHAGPKLQIAVLEAGYGNNRNAHFNGGLISLNNLYKTEGVCMVNNKAAIPCPIGQAITGWLLFYNLSGQESGQFSFQSSSANWPTKTYSKQIWIK